MRSRPFTCALARSRAGLSIVEVTIALAIVATVLAGASGALMSSFAAVRTADGLSSGTLFLESVLENLSLQPYDDLLSFHGNRLCDGSDEDHSRYAVELSVFESELGLMQIRAVLREVDGGRELGRVNTLRSAR